MKETIKVSVVLDLKWNASDFVGDKATWVLNGSNMMIDDDGLSNNDVGGALAEVYVDGTLSSFNYSSGLERCVSDACDDGSTNEDMPTHWHIAPAGLPSGQYNGTITYTTTRHAGT